jgi:hypothetical protein
MITDTNKAFDYVIDTFTDSIDFPNVEMGNDGIGRYEFWGQVCNDKGEDYYYVDESDREMSIDFPMIDPAILIDIVKYYNDEECLKSTVSQIHNDVMMIVHYTVQNITIVGSMVTFSIHWDDVEKVNL